MVSLSPFYFQGGLLSQMWQNHPILFRLQCALFLSFPSLSPFDSVDSKKTTICYLIHVVCIYTGHEYLKIILVL